MKRKRQKHYLTEAAIIKDIDAAHRKLKRLRDRAVGEQSAAELCDEKVERDKHLDAAEEYFKKYDRLENTRLVRLRKTLAAFRTKPLPVDGLSEEGVVLEKVDA